MLYDDLVHVDFDVLSSTDVGEHNQGLPVVVLWERDGLSASLPGTYRPDIGTELRWMEARMWTWSWYIQTKIIRGELYEALDGLQYVRNQVLFHLVAFERRVRPAGARRMSPPSVASPPRSRRPFPPGWTPVPSWTRCVRRSRSIES